MLKIRIKYCVILLLFMQSCDFWKILYEISDKSIHTNRLFNLNDSLQIKLGCRSQTIVSSNLYLFQRFISVKPMSKNSFKVSQNGCDLPFNVDYAKDGKWVKMTGEKLLPGRNYVRLTFRSLEKCDKFIVIQETDLFGENDTLIIRLNPNDVVTEGTFLDTPPIMQESP